MADLAQEVQKVNKVLAVLSEKINTNANQVNMGNPQKKQYQQEHQNRQQMNNRQNRQFYPTNNQYYRNNNRQYHHNFVRQNTSNNQMRQAKQFQGQWNSTKPNRWRTLGKYCHSCGNCDHWSAQCKWPSIGHNNQATWFDKKGGSLDNCGNC